MFQEMLLLVFPCTTLPVTRPHRKWGDNAKGLPIVSFMEIICFA